MTPRLLLLAPLCGALLVCGGAGCSSGPKGDGGTSTGGATTGTSSGTGGTTGAGVGTACDPSATVDTTCEPAGLACQGLNLSDGGIGGACAVPGDQQTCIPSVGCVPGFSCVAGVFATGTTCVQPCSQSADCQSAYKSCVPHLISATQAGCYINACGPGSGADGGMGNGTGYYAACNGQGTDDANCIPFTVQSGAAGFCVQGGSVAQNQPCGTLRSDDAGLCVSGEVCVFINVDNGGTYVDASACLPLCTLGPPTSADGGPGCDQGSSCIVIAPGQPFGACFQSCPLANPNCPAPLVCLGVGDPNNGVCGPI